MGLAVMFRVCRFHTGYPDPAGNWTRAESLIPTSQYTSDGLSYIYKKHLSGRWRDLDLVLLDEKCDHSVSMGQITFIVFLYHPTNNPPRHRHKVWSLIVSGGGRGWKPITASDLKDYDGNSQCNRPTEVCLCITSIYITCLDPSHRRFIPEYCRILYHL